MKKFMMIPLVLSLVACGSIETGEVGVRTTMMLQ